VTEGRLSLIASAEEIARRRARLPKGLLAEAWPDAAGVGFWVGAESRANLDAADTTPIAVELSLPASVVPIYYGPWLCDLEALPAEDSVRTRVLSVHGIAAVWYTMDGRGQRRSYESRSPADPIFHLRRPGGAVSHLWRLFPTKAEAIAALAEEHGRDSEVAEWAERIPAEDFEALLRAHARPER
jgi:hypothetical protein